MEKMLNVNIRVNFNLRKGKKMSTIYAVFFWNGRQWKTNTCAKVKPEQWDSHLQLAIESNQLTRLDNRNNRITNKRLNEIRQRVEEKKEYICRIEACDIHIINEYKHAINPEIKTRNIMKINRLVAVTIFSQVAEKHVKGSTLSMYKSIINTYKQFVIECGKSDELTAIDGDMLDDFCNWLIDNEKSIATIKQYDISLKALIKWTNQDKGLGVKIDVTGHVPPKDKRNKTEQKSKQIALTETELLQMYNLQHLSPNEEKARDIFILQCLVGQRISDMPKLFDGQYTIDETNNTITFNNQKTGTPVTIYLFSMAHEILDKYGRNGLKFNTKKINNILKKVGEKAGLTDIVTYTKQEGDKVNNIGVRKYELLHTHTARHTFITLMLRNNVDKEVIRIVTGHNDLKMINEVYEHLTASDSANRLTKALSENTNLANSALFRNASQSTQQSEIKEAKRVVQSAPEQVEILGELIKKQAIENYQQGQTHKEEVQKVKDKADTQIEMLASLNKTLLRDLHTLLFKGEMEEAKRLLRDGYEYLEGIEQSASKRKGG